jgi:hypothetical protein
LNLEFVTAACADESHLVGLPRERAAVDRALQEAVKLANSPIENGCNASANSFSQHVEGYSFATSKMACPDRRDDRRNLGSSRVLSRHHRSERQYPLSGTMI